MQNTPTGPVVVTKGSEIIGIAQVGSVLGAHGATLVTADSRAGPGGCAKIHRAVEKQGCVTAAF